MRARNGDVELCYDVLADSGEPLLLITGSGQMIQWPTGFCDALVGRGFRPARFDNRDSGRSTHLHDVRAPSALALTLRRSAAVPYRLEDMADDAAAVLDALGWDSAHVVGAAQGGMIAQKLAVRSPGRVRTLTSISSTASTAIGRPSPGTLLAILRVARRPITSRDDYVRHLVDLLPVSRSPAYPPDEQWLREIGAACFDRGHDQAGVQRQGAAFAAGGDRRAELAAVTAPTLVVHGEEDRLIRLPGGRATADAIPGARLVTYPGMGSDLPRELWDAVADEIRDLAAVARR
jgi:pimeloyl-ACP methyl ester carboxylesterase